MATIAVVPARGGSKSIPRKNLAVLGGRTLLELAIESGLGSGRIDQIIVSTEDHEIAAVAGAAGATVIDRPAHLAGDDVRTAPVVVHAIESICSDDDIVVLLQATSPFRTADHVSGCLELFVGARDGSALSVSDAGPHPWKTLIRWGDDWVPANDVASLEAPRQTLPEALAPNGAVYVLRAGELRRTGAFVAFPVRPYVMSKVDGLDIDTPEDLMLAEALLKARGAS